MTDSQLAGWVVWAVTLYIYIYYNHAHYYLMPVSPMLEPRFGENEVANFCSWAQAFFLLPIETF